MSTGVCFLSVTAVLCTLLFFKADKIVATDTNGKRVKLCLADGTVYSVRVPNTSKPYTHTSPSIPDNTSVGVDAAHLFSSQTSQCPHGHAHVDRYMCPEFRHESNRFQLSAYGHLGSDCVQIDLHFQESVCHPEFSDQKCHLNSVPTPTFAQQRYQRHEIVALTHFNMATFVQDADPACNANNWNKGKNSSNPLTFNPEDLNISNWIASYKAVGAKHAVLTAKHGCGFLLWNTSTTLPNGKQYDYAVQRSIPSFQRNVLFEFSTQLREAGLGYGYYYSTGNNFYLNRVNFQPAGPLLPGQVNVTDDEYNALVFQHLTNLWSQFGNLTEIWFDHGYSGAQKDALQQLLRKFQPNAAGFNGAGIMPSPVKWCGTESGYPSYPMWATGCSSSTGSPNASNVCPVGVDTTLQLFDRWFWMPDVPIRTLQDLIGVYHHSVGNNGVLELDFAIDRSGNVDPIHAARYREFGNWIRNCYTTPAANTSGVGVTARLSFPNGKIVDRFMLQEAFEEGERVRSWTISVLETNTTAPKQMAQGTVIGYKQIVLMEHPMSITTAVLEITSAVISPIVRTFAAFRPCPHK